MIHKNELRNEGSQLQGELMYLHCVQGGLHLVRSL